MFANPKKRARRRGLPIMGYVGPNGSGKSACAVWDSMPSLASGRSVLSTVRLLDFEDPRPCTGLRGSVGGVTDCELCQAGDAPGHLQAHPLWLPFTQWDQLLEAEHVDVLMDEVTGVASSRESHSMPAPVANTLVQMRRRDVVIRWTAPSWARADKIIRETSQAVTYCVGYLPKQVETGPVDEDRVWRSRRLYKWRTYDATEFEDFTAGKRQNMSPILVDWHWGPSSGVYDAYDTFDSVLSIGTVTEGGTCYSCGGRRRAPECSCSDYREGRERRTRGPRLRGAGAANGSPVSDQIIRHDHDTAHQ